MTEIHLPLAVSDANVHTIAATNDQIVYDAPIRRAPKTAATQLLSRVSVKKDVEVKMRASDIAFVLPH